MANELLTTIKEKLDHVLDDDTRRRINIIAKKQKGPFQVDQFGFDPETLKAVAPLFVWLYKHYFRVETFGAHNITTGPMMVVANHSGQLPFDGAMIVSSFLLEPKKPIFLRGMVEKWASNLPFVSTFLSRCGQVIGTPSTCKTLLKNKEGVIVFPEGVTGITKLFSERYQLKNFGTGFMRIALAAKTPITPVALIGAEEQAPCVLNLETLAKKFSLPALPLVFPHILPLPLPVKYRIYIGKPLKFEGDGTEDDQEISAMVKETKNCIQNMINKGLKKRKHVFF